jgi:hypothetical protein
VASCHQTFKKIIIVYLSLSDVSLCAGGVVTHKDLGTYIHAVAFTLAQDYGFTRVMSSYYFEENTDRGPPFYDDGYYS